MPVTLRTLLAERPHATLYMERGPEGPVTLKVLASEHPEPQELRRFDNELDITRELRIRGVRRGLRRAHIEGRHALVLEYVEGHPPEPHAVRDARELTDFLHFAIQVAEILARLHAHHVTHRGIQPSNLLYDARTRTVTLIDFGLSTRVDLKPFHPGNAERLEGEFAYLSPEATGRMNRVVDWRSDLYSLGVTFFELLTGQLPFLAQDALEWVHCHLTRRPPAPHTFNPRVPEVLSELVLKLLSKDAEDRYQSAAGLAADLRRCQESLQRTGAVERFPLGQDDLTSRLQLPGRLYGREAELATLRATFEHVGHGTVEAVWVSGALGVGKSTLVHELHRDVAERRGHFVEGTFVPLPRGAPYSAFADALGQCLDALLTEGEEVLAAWRQRIQEAVGELGGVLMPLLPGLEAVLGGRPPGVLELDGEETRHRLQYVLRRFVHALGPAEHPLVLFLDDLHQADDASLELLRALLTGRGDGHVLVVGAYQEDGVGAGHPLLALLDELREDSVAPYPLHLDGLSEWDVRALLADGLRLPDLEVAPLAALLHEQTRGNAFFVRWLVGSLHARGLLTFDEARRRWTWDLERLRGEDLTGGVAGLLASHLCALPETARELLKVAACLGSRFDLRTLAMASAQPREAVTKSLWPALAAKLLTPLGTSGTGEGDVPEYAFAHEQAWRATYALITEAERPAVHLHVGRLLWEGLSPTEREPRLFELVHHLDVGAGQLGSAQERQALAQLNLDAGLRAACASAHTRALGYFEQGLSLLPPDAWEGAYPLTLALHGEAALAASLVRDFARAEALAAKVLERARSALDLRKAYDARLSSAVARGTPDEALRLGLELLQRLGVTFPTRPLLAHVMAAQGRVKLALARRSIESLAELPPMEDEVKRAAMEVLAKLLPVAHRAGGRLYPLFVLKLVSLSLRHGNTPASVPGYASHASLLCGEGDVDSGHRFGQLALRLGDLFGTEAQRGRVLFLFHHHVHHWREPLGGSVEPLLEAHRLALQTGARSDAAWAALYRLVWMFHAGRALDAVAREVAGSEDLFQQDEGAREASALLRQVVAGLTTPGEPQGPRERAGAVPDRTHPALFHAFKLQLACVFDASEEALSHAEALERNLDAIAATPLVPLFHFYSALARVAAWRKRPLRTPLLRAARQSAALLRRWSQGAPANYQHKSELVQAELARAAGKPRKARELYDAALTSARLSGFLQEEALVLECSARFHAEQGNPALALKLLREAALVWKRWGATARMEALMRQHPELAAPFLVEPASAPRYSARS